MANGLGRSIQKRKTLYNQTWPTLAASLLTVLFPLPFFSPRSSKLENMWPPWPQLPQQLNVVHTCTHTNTGPWPPHTVKAVPARPPPSPYYAKKTTTRKFVGKQPTQPPNSSRAPCLMYQTSQGRGKRIQIHAPTSSLDSLRVVLRFRSSRTAC